jgi:predicted nucleotidyltransferase
VSTSRLIGPDELIVVARRLGELNREAVFVGGAVVPLLVTDAGAEAPRPTTDVDVVVELTSRTAFSRLEERLRALGFAHDMTSNEICRWQVEGITVDVMPSDESVLGFSNRWYADVFASPVVYPLAPDVTIRLIAPALMLATKLEAFHGSHREHAGDYYASRDMEDIVTLLDGRPELPGEIQGASPELRAYLMTELGQIRNDPRFIEALPYLVTGDQTGPRRAGRLLARLASLTS